MKKLFCAHDWKRVGNIKHLRYDYGGQEVITAMCQCYKCNRMKERKFLGHQVGDLFE